MWKRIIFYFWWNRNRWKFFGARRIKGVRGRGVPKTKVFGMKKRGDKVYILK